MNVWGNPDDDQKNQDLVSNLNNHNILKVNDVNDGQNHKIAAHAVNSDTNADARALKVEGMTEIVTNDMAQAPGAIGLLVTDPSENPLSRALKVEATSGTEGKIAMEIVNEGSDSTSRALKVKGRTEIEAVLQSDPEVTATTGLTVKNNSQHPQARAMLIQGQTRIEHVFLGQDVPAITLEVSNPSSPEDSRALYVHGLSEFADNPREDPEIPCVLISRGEGAANARALKVLGMSELVADSEDNPASIGLKVSNASTHADARALKVEGKFEVDGGVVGDLSIQDAITVGPSDGPGSINSGGSEQNAQDLQFGTGSGTNNVKIARSGFKTTIQGDLDVDGEVNINDEVHLNDHTFMESSASVSGDLACESLVDVNGVLSVGPDNAAGKIDSGGVAGTPRDLNVGTQSKTKDLALSRTGKTTKIQGSLQVIQAAGIQGELNLGTANADGTIDACDANNRDVKIGGNTTRNVLLSRQGQIAKIMGNLVLNSTQLVMDGQSSLANGSGQFFNVVGQNPGHPSFDFYVAGVLIGHIDDLGFHNP